jgi:hypothetical protein
MASPSERPGASGQGSMDGEWVMLKDDRQCNGRGYLGDEVMRMGNRDSCAHVFANNDTRGLLEWRNGGFLNDTTPGLGMAVV